MSAGQRGASIVEAAIAMSLALLIVFGIIEFGRVLFAYHALSDAARLGTRYAIVRGTTCTAAGCPASASSIRDYVRAQSMLSDPEDLSVTTNWSGTDTRGNTCTSASHAAGCLVTVQTSYTYSYGIIPLPPLTLSSTSKMVISQ